MSPSEPDLKLKKQALSFIVLMGLVSLFSDMTYEGARSLTGPYLGLLGASAFAVGLVAGLGEFIGYGLRLATGLLADRTRNYWLLTFIGYGLNLLAVPLLALTGRWELAAMLIVAERMGKAIRKPARDAMMSYAARQVGTGYGFALEEFLDQLGAMLGPLFLALIVFLNRGLGTVHSYRRGFAFLLLPALLAMVVLTLGRIRYPEPSRFEIKEQKVWEKKFGRRFWLYLIGTSFLAAGFADFPLLGFHFQKTSLFAGASIPLLYTLAMGIDAVAALIFGRLFDRIGLGALMISTLISAFFAPLVFLSRQKTLVIAGIVLWGIGMGALESILKAVVANMISPEKRATAYGIFNAIFGAAWFAGSALMGFLYSRQLGAMVLFSVLAQVAAAFLFFRLSRMSTRPGPGPT
ncbi:MAG: MFS transporter [Candidatus Saccharicenans sp.]|jgi:predicted MFS family arabinose efflux permease|nr:MFS transporter [Candidatus Saccharicenans sp.]MDH7575799.1 MFS transporter [Candidatus Saccharicenans sp.]